MEREEFIALIKLGRIHLVMITLLFYTLGSTLAVIGGYGFDLGRFLFGLGIATAAILSMSYSNNYYDAEADQYNTPTPFSGGNIKLWQNKHLHRLLKPVALFFMSLSLIFTIIVITIYSFPLEFLLYVIAGNLLAWYYAAPPLKFAYRGFGEVIAIITAGLMLPGFGYFILAKTLDLLFLLFSLPLMLYILIFILNAEIPDVESDRKGKKKNLIIRTNPHYGLQIASLCGVIVVLYSLMLSFAHMLTVAIDFNIIALLSLLPCTVVIISIIPWFERRFGTLRLVMNNLTAVVLDVLFTNVYFLALVLFR